MPKLKEWELAVFTPEIGATKTLLVSGDMMAAEVILKLSSALGEYGRSGHCCGTNDSAFPGSHFFDATLLVSDFFLSVCVVFLFPSLFQHTRLGLPVASMLVQMSACTHSSFHAYTEREREREGEKRDMNVGGEKEREREALSETQIQSMFLESPSKYRFNIDLNLSKLRIISLNACSVVCKDSRASCLSTHSNVCDVFDMC